MSDATELPANVCEAIKRLFPAQLFLIVRCLDERTVRIEFCAPSVELTFPQLQKLASLLGTEDIAVEVVAWPDYGDVTGECEITCTGVDVLGLGRS